MNVKRIPSHWRLILVLAAAIVAGIRYYSYSHLHPQPSAVLTFVPFDHVAPLDHETFQRWRKNLPDDFFHDVVLSASCAGFTVRPTADVAIRRNTDMNFEVICLDGYSSGEEETSHAVVRRALIRTGLALDLARLWELELARAAPVVATIALDSTDYIFSANNPDGKILLGTANESNNGTQLMPLTDLLASYVLSEPVNRPPIEQELNRLVTAALALRVK